MTKYPKINSDDFYKRIRKMFKQYEIKDKNLTLDDICYPTSYKLQIPQQFVKEFMNTDTPYKGLLLFHQIGAGKTCAAVSIAENFKKSRNILVVTPASLMGNFYKELRTECTGDEYLKPDDRKVLNEFLLSLVSYLLFFIVSIVFNVYLEKIVHSDIKLKY